MITVPTLKSGQTPYDPVAFSPPAFSPDTSSPDEPTPEEILTHALVKNALTTLHQEDDERFESLKSRTGHELSTLVKDHEFFLKNQKMKYQNEFQSEPQKHLFATITAPYFSWSLARVEGLYTAKVRQFHHETITRQNDELLDRLLSPETLFDDNAQTVYRDMILHNLEMSATHLPADALKQRLTEAAKTIYTKIIEKRLETDPARLSPILTSRTVQHALSPDELTRYESLAEQAIVKETLKRTAQECVAEGVTKRGACQRMSSSTKTEEEKALFAQYFDDALFNQNRKKVLATILNAMNVWSLVTEAQPNPDAIPPWVARANPELYDHILSELSIRQKCAGRPHPVDYVSVLGFIAGYAPHRTMKTLAEESAVYALIAKSGGSDSEPFGIILRLLLGTLERDDVNWITAMRFALDSLGDKTDSEKADVNVILTRFAETRRIRLARQDGEELDERQLREIMDEF